MNTVRATFIAVLLGVLIGGGAAAPARANWPSLPVIDFCRITPADVTVTFPTIGDGFGYNDTDDSYANKTNGCLAYVVDVKLGPPGVAGTNWASFNAGVSEDLNYLVYRNPSVCSNSKVGVHIYRAYGALGTGFQSLAYATFGFSWNSAEAKCSMNFVSGTSSWKWPWQGWYSSGCKVPAAATFAPDTIRVAAWWKVAGPLWDVYPPVTVFGAKYTSSLDPGPTPTC